LTDQPIRPGMAANWAKRPQGSGEPDEASQFAINPDSASLPVTLQSAAVTPERLLPRCRGNEPCFRALWAQEELDPPGNSVVISRI
jgi:hypothetical protein